VRVVQEVNNNQSPREVHALKPGWNQFPSQVWKQNETNPSIQSMIKKKMIEFMDAKVRVRIKTSTGKVKLEMRQVGTDDRPVRLRYFDEKQAIEIAKNTWDREMLQVWLDEETRHRVKKALTKQVEPLLNKGGQDDDDDGDGFEEIETYETD
jgi:hypothetical protein